MGARAVLLDKKKVLRSVQLMPDRFSLDDLVDRMIILEKIEKGIADIEAGRTFTLAETKERLSKLLHKRK